MSDGMVQQLMLKTLHHTQTLKKVMPTSAVDSHFRIFATTVTFLIGAKILASQL
jgi:hypothetical protein